MEEKVLVRIITKDLDGRDYTYGYVIAPKSFKFNVAIVDFVNFMGCKEKTFPFHKLDLFVQILKEKYSLEIIKVKDVDILKEFQKGD